MEVAWVRRGQRRAGQKLPNADAIRAAHRQAMEDYERATEEMLLRQQQEQEQAAGPVSSLPPGWSSSPPPLNLHAAVSQARQPPPPTGLFPTLYNLRQRLLPNPNLPPLHPPRRSQADDESSDDEDSGD